MIRETKHVQGAKKFFICLLLGVLVMLLILGGAACRQEEPQEEPGHGNGEPHGEDPGNGNGGGEGGGGEPVDVDYAALGVNELGEIMVLMYHRFGDTEDEWVRTPENFRRDLENLYAAGYRPVLMSDVLDGRIDIPAGTSPVVLTFDDGTEGQFRLVEQGGDLVADPGCAVGIMEQFHEEHPDFGLAGTFYLFSGTPFGQYEYVQQKLDYLVERGFEIGNHTYTHPPWPGLRTLSPGEAKKELAYFVQWIREYLPGYQVRSLALPYGSFPDDLSYLVEGSYEGIEYHNEGILLVGSNPAPSPFDRGFDPAAIPRIRASELEQYTVGYGMYDWMEVLREEPGRRYVSDGNPETVVVPEELKEQVDLARVGRRTVVTY